jgi:hypothetical protein
MLQGNIADQGCVVGKANIVFTCLAELLSDPITGVRFPDHGTFSISIRVEVGTVDRSSLARRLIRRRRPNLRSG